MTKSEIIDETIEYYKTHDRGIDYLSIGERCTYSTVDGRKCAVGRCLTQKGIEKALSKDWGSIINIDGDQVEPFFYKRYKGHDIDFWDDLQRLHDSNKNWERNNIGGWDLSDIGKREVNEIKHLLENENNSEID